MGSEPEGVHRPPDTYVVAALSLSPSSPRQTDTEWGWEVPLGLKLYDRDLGGGEFAKKVRES